MLTHSSLLCSRAKDPFAHSLLAHAFFLLSHAFLSASLSFCFSRSRRFRFCNFTRQALVSSHVEKKKTEVDY
jgi:hypothetical protein